jgi:hypothetical protein
MSVHRVVGSAFVSLPPALWQIAWTLLITNYEFSFHSCSHAEGFRHFPPPSTNENWKLAFNTYSLNLILLNIAIQLRQSAFRRLIASRLCCFPVWFSPLRLDRLFHALSYVVVPYTTSYQTLSGRT